MRLYRLARAPYADDLTGAGARLHGGRWNHKGTPVLYTAGTRSLAILEFLVHLPLGLTPPDLRLVELEIRDDAGIRDLDPGVLPEDWRTVPPPSALADLGSDWLRGRETAMLRVPSAVVDEERNILVNPDHPDAVLSILTTQPFPIDPRLLASR